MWPLMSRFPDPASSIVPFVCEPAISTAFATGAAIAIGSGSGKGFRERLQGTQVSRWRMNENAVIEMKAREVSDEGSVGI